MKLLVILLSYGGNIYVEKSILEYKKELDKIKTPPLSVYTKTCLYDVFFLSLIEWQAFQGTDKSFGIVRGLQ